ncbi:homeobox protein unc-4 homolog [Phycodurus eques]|uniref:homeobox protein unc-4 homolog n=1 Tax=Phycodurus eques TaxID=693459 RepID=UPI002ACEFC71|nr:homeobox protein unc-4 homolog [Phycodurus eques]
MAKFTNIKVNGCPSLLCEELETKGSQEMNKTSEEGEEEDLRDEEDGENEGDASERAPQEEADAKNVTKVDHGSPEQKNSRRTRTKKPNERPKNKNGERDAVEDKPEAAPVTSEENFALTEPPVGLTRACDLSEPVYLGCGGSGPDGPPAPVPVVDSSQNSVPMQPSPLLQQTVSQHPLEPLEMEITQVYSTRRSIRYSTRGRGRAPNFPLLPELESMADCLLPPPPKKKTRTFYSTDQLEHLEALFQEDHYPDAEKRKAIAASVGVTPQRIMVWFQNRRAKWRKAERLVSSKAEQRHSRGRWSPARPHTHPAVPNMAATASSTGAPVVSVHFGTKMPTVEPVRPFTTLSTHTLSSVSHLLATSPGQSRMKEQPDFHPRPMRSPPPLRRASLPPLAAAYELNTPPPPLFVDDGASLAHCDSQALQTDASSLFDFADKLDYLAPGHQSNAQLSFQLQTSCPPAQLPPPPPLQQQQQQQTSTSLPPRVAFLTPSPYLTPNPSDAISTSYFTFGPAGNSTGGVTYSMGGHSYVKSQGGGQILLQPTNHHGGMASYQSYPWANVYAQPSVRQLAPNYPAGFTGAAARDLQMASSSANVSTCFQRTFTHDGTTVLPPVSSLQPSRLRAESGMAAKGAAVAPLLPSQASPGSLCSPVAPSCVKIEYDSPREIHSHFHCDFSPIQF